MSGEDLDIIVEFDDDRFDVYTNTEETLGDLKHIIYTMTDIPAFRQCFLNLNMPARLQNDNCKLKELNIKSNFILKMVDIMCEPLPTTTTSEDEDDNQVEQKFECEKKLPCIRSYHPDRLKKQCQVKAVGLPRDDKKLAVLDLDQTIYDCGSPHKKLYGRPFLQEFLTRIYDNYDIGIWSNTDMRVVERKLEVLGIDSHPDYQLLFYMDVYSSVPVPMSEGVFQVKDLQAVWNKYPQYNYTNTVICDDREENFFFNPKNGILVAPYFYQDRKKDDELLKLMDYLNYIAESNNLTMFDHKRWKSSCGTGTKKDGD